MVFARMTLVRLLATVLGALLASSPAAAHLTPNSEIALSIGANAVAADIIVPMGDYAFATGHPVRNDARSLSLARDYLARHFVVTTRAGQSWQVRIGEVAFVRIAGPPDLHATARLVPPAGASTRQFRVHWSAVLNELPNHFALFVLTADSGGLVGQGREVLGTVRAGSAVLDIDRGDASAGKAFANGFMLGVHHILEGYDHLLFLLALLLPAPLVARAGRWSEMRSLRDTVVQLLKIVTAFTIGHSLTLVGATVGDWSLPAAPVEIAIALSVLVSAVHAIRPLVPGREPSIALGFGLVHGLAFATLLHDAGASAASTVATLLGFNVGIEAVQIGMAALVMPALFALSRTRAFPELRVCLAGLAAGAALLWILDRTTGAGVYGVELIESALHHGAWGIALLYALAFWSLSYQRRRRQSI